MRTSEIRQSRIGLAVGGALLALALAALTPGEASADDIYWNEATGGAFDLSANWSPQQVPGANDTAVFDLWQSPAYLVTFPAGATVNNLRCHIHTDEVEMDLNGAAYWLSDGLGLAVGEYIGDWGQLRMTGGEVHAQSVATGPWDGSYGLLELGAGMALYVAADLVAGDWGIGDVAMYGGAQVQANSVLIGWGTSGCGYAGVYDANTDLDVNNSIAVGIEGQGFLDLGPGAEATTCWMTIGVNDWGNGEVDVLGADAHLAVTEGVYVGDWGSGYLHVGEGASVEANWVDFAASAAAYGEAWVAQADSMLTTNLDLTIGCWGEGRLSIADGAAVRSLGGWISIARDPGSIGFVEIFGSTLRAEQNPIVVADCGQGTLEAYEGAQIYSGSELLAGRQADGSASIILDGADTQLEAHGIYPTLFGEFGHADLSIANGAALRCYSPIVIADQAGSTGDVDVSAGTVDCIGQFIVIGNGGQGTLTAHMGAQVHADRDLTVGHMGEGTLIVEPGAEVRTFEPSGWIMIGREAGSVGHVTVDGGTLRADQAPLLAGDHGHATLDLLAGAQVYSDGELFAGTQADGSATILIQGAGSRYESNSVYPTKLGDHGTADVTIADGGWLAVRWGCIMGKNAGSTGSLTLTGPGSTFEVPILLVGREGAATVTVNDGRVALGVDPETVPAGELHLGPDAELGGTGTIAGSVVNHQGTVWPGGSIGSDIWTGILSVTGDYVQQPDSGLYIELGGPILGDEYCALHVTGTATLDGELHVLPVNNFVPQPGQEFEILTADAVVGEFTWVHGDSGPYCTVYEPTRVTIALAEAGDCTYDCRVDADDLEYILSCWAGPDELIPEHCRCGDADRDWDVDLADFAEVQTRATGA